MNRILRLTSENEIEQLTSLSHQRPTLIFKHSTACPISSRSYGLYRDYVEGTPADADVLFTEVYVIEHRTVSNAIAGRFGVRHESPQALLISNGESVWHASHWEITEEAIDAARAQATGQGI